MQLRDWRGRFSVKGMEMTRNRKQGLVVVAVVIGCVVYGSVAELVKPNVIHATNVAHAEEVITLKGQPDRLDEKIRVLKGEVLDSLAKCESGGRKEEDGIVVLDSNEKGSYGPYQFQRTTVMYYYEKMTGEKISGRDAVILALQGDKARELAEFVIFETGSGIAKDWVNCSRWHGLQEKVDLIKSLEK